MIGTSHTSIREPQNVAQLSRTFSQGLSAVDLAEPLRSLDNTQPVEAARELLEARGIAVLGVRRDGAIAGWVAASDLTIGTLGDCLQEFPGEAVLGEDASLDAVLGALATAEHVFIEWCGEVAGVITRRDLQKPPLRMWLFGAITVLDSNMTWAIEELYPHDTWRDLISPGRCAKAGTLRAHREQSGSDCRLVDCLQISDKADILVSDRASFGALGLNSRGEANRLTREIESLRNHLAHTQQLEPAHLATAARLASVIDSVLRAEVAQRIVALRREMAAFESPNLITS